MNFYEETKRVIEVWAKIEEPRPWSCDLMMAAGIVDFSDHETERCSRKVKITVEVRE